MELQSKYDLGKSEFYNFLKIKTALSKSKIHKSSSSLPSFFSNINKLGHQVSYIYKLLRPKAPSLNKNIITFWEQHSSNPLSESQWSQIYNSVSHCKLSPVLSQIKLWLIHKAYWTPACLHSQNLRPDSSCWNCKEGIGDLPHLIHCKTLSKFWD